MPTKKSKSKKSANEAAIKRACSAKPEPTSGPFDLLADNKYEPQPPDRERRQLALDLDYEVNAELEFHFCPDRELGEDPESVGHVWQVCLCTTWAYQDREPCIYVDDRKGLRAETARMLPRLQALLPDEDVENWVIIQACIDQYSTPMDGATIAVIRKRQSRDATLNSRPIPVSTAKPKRSEIADDRRAVAADLEKRLSHRVDVRWHGGHIYQCTRRDTGRVFYVDDRKGDLIKQVTAEILRHTGEWRDSLSDSAA